MVQKLIQLTGGKVKNIGTCYITYYGKFDIATNAGKVKAIRN